jgi:proteasome lid subunit RPN8/RPN11
MGRPVKLRKRVVRKIREHALSSMRNEVIGLLLGSIRKNKLVVTDLVTGKQTCSPTHVALEDEFLVSVAFDYGRLGKRKSIVGWYHSHPDMGCFVSGVDFETQRRFQLLFPDAIGLIVDPSVPEKLEMFRVDQEKATWVSDYLVY